MPVSARDDGARRAGNGRFCRDGRGRRAAFFRRRNSDRRSGRVGRCDANKSDGWASRFHCTKRTARSRPTARSTRARSPNGSAWPAFRRRPRRDASGATWRWRSAPERRSISRTSRPRESLDLIRAARKRGAQRHLRGHAASLQRSTIARCCDGVRTPRWRRRCARRATSRRCVRRSPTARSI